MVKLSNVGLLVVILSATAFGRQAFQGSCTKGGQVVILQGINSTTKVQASYPGCTVSVFNHGLATLATIFDDNGVSLANPFTASVLNGVFLFSAANGHYDVVLSGGTPNFPTPETITDILLNDPTASNTVTATAFISASANPATSGVLQVASADTLACWKSNLGGPDLCFTKNSSDVVDLNAALTVHGPFSTSGNPITASAITGTTGTFSGAITGASYSGGAIAGTTGTFSGAVTATGISGTTGTFSGAITGAGYSGGPISGTTGTFSSNVSAGGTFNATGASTLGGGGSFAGVWNKKNSADTYILQLEDSDAGLIRVLGFNVEQQLQRTGIAADLSFGNVTELWTPLADSATYTGQETALYGSYSHFGSGALTAAAGVEGEAFNPGPATAGLLIGAEGTANCGGVAAGVPNQQTPTNNGNCTNIRAVEGATHNLSSGTATNAVAFFADTPTNTGGGAITNAYGLLVSDQTVGTNKWAIKTGAGTVEFGSTTVMDTTGQVSGTLGVGSAPVSTTGILENNTNLTGTFQIGAQVAPQCSSASTLLCEGIRARFDTAAAAFTTTTGAALHVVEGTKGAGSAITTEYGILIDALSNGGSSFSIQAANQIKSTLATGTAPFVIASTTPVANLTTVPTAYDHTGAQITAYHLVEDSCVLGTSCGVTLAGSSAYTNATSYTCTCQDDTAIAACKVAQTAGNGFTITGTGTDTIRYHCGGN